MHVILELFADETLEVDHDSVLQSDVLNGAYVPQILLIVAVAHSVPQPLNALLAVAAVHHEHFIADVNLEQSPSETEYFSGSNLR